MAAKVIADRSGFLCIAGYDRNDRIVDVKLLPFTASQNTAFLQSELTDNNITYVKAFTLDTDYRPLRAETALIL